MNHNNFRFTPIPDKTNDVIFIQSPKALFLGHPLLTIFGHFCLIGIFPKENLALSHTTICEPLTPC